jgi:rod shape-determining protein MreD
LTLVAENASERHPGIRPGPSIIRRLDAAGRRLFPAVTTLLVVAVLALPLGLPGAPELQQVAALILVWFWSLHRPMSMPASAAFLAGLACDLLGPAPLGIAALTLVATHGAALRLRTPLLRRGLFIAWLAFIALAACVFAAQWVLTALLEFRLVPAAPALFEWALAAGLYPLLLLLLLAVHGTVAAPERA